jgi:hypothetical protein
VIEHLQLIPSLDVDLGVHGDGIKTIFFQTCFDFGGNVWIFAPLQRIASCKNLHRQSIMRRRRGLKSAISILLSEGVGCNTHILSGRR